MLMLGGEGGQVELCPKASDYYNIYIYIYYIRMYIYVHTYLYMHTAAAVPGETTSQTTHDRIHNIKPVGFDFHIPFMYIRT